MVLHLWRSYQAQNQTLLPKLTIHGAVQFMSLIHYYKETQLSCQSGDFVHVHGSTLVARHFMQYQYIWYSTLPLVISQLNFMWCLMMSSSWYHSLGKAQFPQIGQILCNSAQKAAPSIILTSGILGSIQVLRNIPEKIQDMIQASLQIITIKSSLNLMYNKVCPYR